MKFCKARDASPSYGPTIRYVTQLSTDVIVSVMTSLIAKTDCHWLRRPDHVTCTTLRVRLFPAPLSISAESRR